MLLRPVPFLNHMRRYAHAPRMRLVAVSVRLVLGIVLILAAGQSKYPLLLEILGWLSLAGALVLAALPWNSFIRLINWILDRFDRFAWLGGLASIGFGLFLVHAIL